MNVKTNTGLAQYCTAQLGMPYWYGSWGNTATNEFLLKKAKQYPSQYSATRISHAKKNHLGKRVHDCVGLIKGYLWSDTPTSPAKYNSVTDKNVGGMLAKCIVTGAIWAIPDIVGVLVFVNTSHVGIYIGNGYVIEAKGFEHGVIKTKLSAGKWNKWGKLSYIDYSSATLNVPVNGGNPYPESTVNLTKGAKGNEVKWIQYQLVQQGINIGKWGIDGDFGNDTLKGVKEFQKASLITVDGVVGKVTRGKLKNHL